MRIYIIRTVGVTYLVEHSTLLRRMCYMHQHTLDGARFLCLALPCFDMSPGMFDCSYDTITININRCSPAKGSQYMDNTPERSGAAGSDQESQLSAMLSSPSAGGMRLAGNYAHRGSPGEFLCKPASQYSEPAILLEHSLVPGYHTLVLRILCVL